MSLRLPRYALALALAAGAAFSGPLPAAGAAPAAAAAPQYVLLRVGVDAAGKVQSAQPMDAAAIPALVNAATEIARKLTFTPARKDGRGVSSETTLVVTLALVPKPDGSFGISLRRAQNGPSLVSVGRSQQPKVGRDNGAMVVVGADLRADGSVDIDSFKVEQVEMRTPSSFAEERFVDAARHSLKDTQFRLDKVDGIEIPSRISVPFLFNGGPAKPKPGEREPDAKDQKSPPSLTATSKIEGIDLPKIDYTAPGQ